VVSPRGRRARRCRHTRRGDRPRAERRRRGDRPRAERPRPWPLGVRSAEVYILYM